jgi:predicted RNase H-like nuclease (RuvC/YqgF family)
MDIRNLGDLKEELDNLKHALKMVDVFKNYPEEKFKLQLVKDVEDIIDTLINCDVNRLIGIEKEECDGCKILTNAHKKSDNLHIKLNDIGHKMHNMCYNCDSVDELEYENGGLRDKIKNSKDEIQKLKKEIKLLRNKLHYMD